MTSDKSPARFCGSAREAAARALRISSDGVSVRRVAAGAAVWRAMAHGRTVYVKELAFRAKFE